MCKKKNCEKCAAKRLARKTAEAQQTATESPKFASSSSPTVGGGGGGCSCGGRGCDRCKPPVKICPTRRRHKTVHRHVIENREQHITVVDHVHRNRKNIVEHKIICHPEKVCNVLIGCAHICNPNWANDNGKGGVL